MSDPSTWGDLADEYKGRIEGAGLLVAGGFYPPAPLTIPERQETVRVLNPIRRWWFRRQGWSTEWVVIHPAYTFGQDRPRPVRESLPHFEARWGIANAFDVPLELVAPPTKWERRRVKLRWKVRQARERVALVIAPELKPREDDW